MHSCYKQGTSGPWPRPPGSPCLSMFGDVGGAGGISLSPAVHSRWTQVSHRSHESTLGMSLLSPGTLSSPGHPAASLVTSQETQFGHLSLQELLELKDTTRHHKRTVVKTDFVMLCCSLQVEMWPSISRAMLTSAAGNQN